jgi:hypothetical protein
MGGGGDIRKYAGGESWNIAGEMWRESAHRAYFRGLNADTIRIIYLNMLGIYMNTIGPVAL